MKRLLYVLVLVLGIFPALFAYRYNFLNNEKILESTKILLNEAHVNKTALDLWYSNVMLYNMSYTPVIDSQKGWVSRSDTETLRSLSDKPVFPDHFISYSFMRAKVRAQKSYRNKITVGNGVHDVQNITITGFQGMNEEDSTAFRSIFNPVNIVHQPVDQELFIKVNQLYQTWWNKEKLSFDNNPDVSLIQFLCVDSRALIKLSYPRESGIEVRSKGKSYFIAKLGFFNPFVVVEFSTYDDLAQFFMDIQSVKEKEVGYMLMKNREMVWTSVK